MATEVAKQALFFCGIAGTVSAVASGAAAWGTRMVNFIPTQSCTGAAIAGGIFGVGAGLSAAINDKTKLIREALLGTIAIVAIGIIAAAALGPKAAELVGKEISHVASGAFGGVSAVAMFLFIMMLPD